MSTDYYLVCESCKKYTLAYADCWARNSEYVGVLKFIDNHGGPFGCKSSIKVVDFNYIYDYCQEELTKSIETSFDRVGSNIDFAMNILKDYSKDKHGFDIDAQQIEDALQFIEKLRYRMVQALIKIQETKVEVLIF